MPRSPRRKMAGSVSSACCPSPCRRRPYGSPHGASICRGLPPPLIRYWNKMGLLSRRRRRTAPRQRHRSGCGGRCNFRSRCGAKGRRLAPGSMLPRFRNPLWLQRGAARLRRRPSGRLFPNGRPRLRRLRRPQPKETFWQRLTKRPLRLWYRRQPLRGPKPGRWTMRRPRWRRRPAERSPADTGPRNRADPCRSRFRPAAACREMRQTPPPGEA